MPELDADQVTVLLCTACDDGRRAAHLVLSRAAASMLDVPSQAIRIDHEPSGRPFLSGVGNAPHVSVSHGDQVAAVALTGIGPVGVDVEPVRALRAVALARRWLTAAEANWVEDQPRELRPSAFLCLWTQKEAVGKALGSGLRGGGMRRPVTMPDSWPLAPVRTARTVPLPGDPTAAVIAVVATHGLSLAVAVCGRPGLDAEVVVHRVNQRGDPYQL
jgi:4'-phosphopantetheinyl transferase